MLVSHMTGECTGGILPGTTGMAGSITTGHLVPKDNLYIHFPFCQQETQTQNCLIFVVVVGLAAVNTQRKTLGAWAVLPSFRHRLFLRCRLGHFMICLPSWGHVSGTGFVVPRDLM